MLVESISTSSKYKCYLVGAGRLFNSLRMSSYIDILLPHCIWIIMAYDYPLTNERYIPFIVHRDAVRTTMSAPLMYVMNIYIHLKQSALLRFIHITLILFVLETSPSPRKSDNG